MGSKAASVCCAKLVQQAPNLDAKYFAATQVMDEARHVEIYSRLLREKFSLAYPITPPLKALLDDVVRDSRWDMTYLGVQVLIEGLALAAFRLYRDDAKNPLISAISAYIMQDERGTSHSDRSCCEIIIRTSPTRSAKNGRSS
jgi:hypothetical protein